MIKLICDITTKMLLVMAVFIGGGMYTINASADEDDSFVEPQPPEKRIIEVICKDHKCYTVDTNEYIGESPKDGYYLVWEMEDK